ncbi:MAG: hypothetical protein KGZ92_09300 [Firmicutes bacterium]|nr:hypothetical protein [Dethiobacter sp.]MBS3889459.1 hypothetical protein [Bacillota bacterium]
MLEEQLFHIVEMLVLGLFLGALIDFYRVVVALYRPPGATRSAMDILFWVLCGLCTFIYLVRTSSGEARFYVFMLWITGFIIEQKLLGRPLRRGLLVLFKGVLSIVKLFAKVVWQVFDGVLTILVAPLRLVTRLLMQPVRWLGRSLAESYPRLRALLSASRFAINSWWLGEEKKDV